MPAQSHRSLFLLVAAGLIVSVVACGEKKPPATPPQPPPPPPVQTQPAPPPPPPPRPAPTPPPAPPAPSEAEIFSRTSLDDLNKQHPLDDVFFAFDKSDLSDASRTSLQKDAAWLQKWTTTTVLISGHADERGTNEYNLALGERRASATRDFLVSLGVPAARINIVSKGEEEPFCSEHNETCWAQNRRGHFTITTK